MIIVESGVAPRVCIGLRAGQPIRRSRSIDRRSPYVLRPGADTSAVDTRTIASARRSIDLAAFILTNRAIRDALTAAARHGVSVDRLLRTGSAGYFSGEHRQDDDVVIVEIVPLSRWLSSKRSTACGTQAGNEEIGR